MSRLIGFSILILLFSCNGKEPCAVGAGGVYVFPEVPKNSGMTKTEINQFLDLPEDICTCMSTENLIETSLNYPFIGLIDAGSSPQMGYGLVSSVFRGLQELSTRADRAEFLLKKYKAVDPLGYDPKWELYSIGKYILRISYLEIILSQEANLKAFNLAQKIELVDVTRTVYETKKKDFSNYSLYSLATTAAVLARLMKQDQYQPFLNVYKPQERNWDLVFHYWSTDYATTELVYALSDGYLTSLKQQK